MPLYQDKRRTWAINLNQVGKMTPICARRHPIVLGFDVLLFKWIVCSLCNASLLRGLFLRKLLQTVFVHCCNRARVKHGDRLASQDFGICVRCALLTCAITSALGLLQPEWKQIALNVYQSVVWWVLQQVVHLQRDVLIAGIKCGSITPGRVWWW